MTGPALIPIHPQARPGRPDELRWVIPVGTMPFTGRVAAAPGALGALLDDGTLARVNVEPAAVLTRLGPDRSWSREGPRVRTALHAALADPGGWSPVGGGWCPVGEGTDGTRGGSLTVHPTRACHGCPAARPDRFRSRWSTGPGVPPCGTGAGGRAPGPEPAPPRLHAGDLLSRAGSAIRRWFGSTGRTRPDARSSAR